MTTIFAPECRPAQEFSPQENAQRVADSNPERLREAMYFLAGYAPLALEAALDATEPFTLPCACGAGETDGELIDDDPYK